MPARLTYRLIWFAFGLTMAAGWACARAGVAPPPATPTMATRSGPAPSATQGGGTLAPELGATPTPPDPRPTEPPATPVASTAAPVAPTATAPPPDEQILRLPQNIPTAILALDAIAAPRLVIPRLGLDREIVKVPARNGEWDLTQLGQNVGWLETTGQKPGDRLAMVFAGHLTLSFGKVGPFANLWKLRVKDEVIYRAEDMDYVYNVLSKIDADPSETQRLYVEDKHQLLLVTCAEWDYAAWKYGRRLIVVAEAAVQRAAP
jgi:LPXTG-site transpeptidase (sortase) family protein